MDPTMPRPLEGARCRLYDRAGGKQSQVWYLPKASHTAALHQYPRKYERRVVDFLNNHLRERNITDQDG
jgi:hypothetical protein